MPQVKGHGLPPCERLIEAREKIRKREATRKDSDMEHHRREEQWELALQKQTLRLLLGKELY